MATSKLRGDRVVGSRAGVSLPRGWKEKFLKHLEETQLVSAACKATGIARYTAYRHKEQDPEFSQRWDEIYIAQTEVLEQIAVRRAADGSDDLLKFILKGRMPETYDRAALQPGVQQIIMGGEVTMELTDGRQPIELEAAKRREAAKLLLSGGAADVVEGKEAEVDSED